MYIISRSKGGTMSKRDSIIRPGGIISQKANFNVHNPVKLKILTVNQYK